MLSSNLTGYIEWHGPIVGRIEALIEEARSLYAPLRPRRSHLPNMGRWIRVHAPPR